MLPVLAPAIATARTGVIFLGASLSVSGATLLSARFRVHTCWGPIGMFAVAALTLVAARAMGVVERPLGHILVVSAACLMTLAHCVNSRCCRAADCEPVEIFERATLRRYRGPFAGSAMVATDSPDFTGGPPNPYIAYPSTGDRTCSSSRPP
jgi:hypothetical protein